MNHHTPGRGAAWDRLAVLVAVPLLALSVACGGGEGVRVHDGGEFASLPAAPAPATAAAVPGGPSPRPAAGDRSAFYEAQLVYVRCMRAKGGVADFPDPRPGGHLDYPQIDDLVDPGRRGEEYQGGRNAVCLPELRAATALAPARDARQDYASLLSHAGCVRANGVPEFTDPTLSGGEVIPGGLPRTGKALPGAEPPGYERARDLCAKKLIDGLGGAQ
ncbi:hypothetical protein ABZ714_26920 [Streptomyces sp. NPDC006798]|uniref:hypothetical protein n=1 Tax=Streptomyces sp. NPDC006798 TaxID=3155462 RepID=UPI00340D123F